MPHRIYTIATAQVNVFDTKLGANTFMGKNEEGDLTVLIRGHSLYMRRGQVAMTCNLRKEIPDDGPPALVATRQIAEECERQIMLDGARKVFSKPAAEIDPRIYDAERRA